MQAGAIHNMPSKDAAQIPKCADEIQLITMGLRGITVINLLAEHTARKPCLATGRYLLGRTQTGVFIVSIVCVRYSLVALSFLDQTLPYIQEAVPEGA
jgi:hypothetical protein